MCDPHGLQADHLELIHGALAAASPRGARMALDLACGAGAKTTWLAERCAPGAVVLGIDLDRAALGAARASSPAGVWVVADALSLPLRPGSVELVWCVAALGLFADQRRALAEMTMALAPGGALVVATAGERWVRPRRWPSGVAEALRGAPRPADDLGAELREALAGAGLIDLALVAYLLDPPGLAPLDATLPLAELESVAPSEIGEPEVLPVLLVGVGRQQS